MQSARAELQFDWVFCFDADERVTGNLRAFANGLRASDCDGVRIRLFDAYMTPDDFAPYQPGRELMGFRRFFGPEERDILMLWRNRPEVYFAEQHAREPGGIERLRTDLQCQHYGKSLSIEHWEETCDYYIRHFPFDTYGRKWLIEKAGQSTPSLISCALFMNGVTRFLRAQSRFDPLPPGRSSSGARGLKFPRPYSAGAVARRFRVVAGRIDARQFNRHFRGVFPRFVQHAIWQYCSQSGLDVCNGNRIDDNRRCPNRDCRVRLMCDRLTLRRADD